MDSLLKELEGIRSGAVVRTEANLRRILLQLAIGLAKCNSSRDGGEPAALW
jgi:hypothetical protein